MAQNINMQYVFMQNAGVLAPGQTDQLPLSSLQGAMSMHCTNPGGQAISDHKLNLGFTQVQAQKKMYHEWWNCGKDQMIGRGFAPAGRTAKRFPDADLLPIYTGMRTLRPACGLIVYTVAANDMYRLEDIEKAVLELVKGSCRKLNDTNNKGKRVVPNPAIPPGQVVVQASLVPPGASNQWGAATTIGNPGQLPPNPPLAQVPAGGQLGQAPPGTAGPNVAAAGQLGQAPPGAAGPNVPAAQVNVPTVRQRGQAAPGAAGPNTPAAQVNVAAAGQHGKAPPGAAGPHVPAEQVNVAAAGTLGLAPPAAAVPNVPAAQVNVPAAGQLGQAPAGDVPTAGPDVPVQPGNDRAHPAMVSDPSSPDNDPAPAQMLPDPPHNGPAAVQNQPVARGFRPACNRRPTSYSLPKSSACFRFLLTDL